MPTETWYVLETGEAVSPSEVTTGKDGKLHHKTGAVAMRGDVPMSRSVDPDEERKKLEAKKAAAGEKPKPPSRSDREIKAERDEGPKYKTR